MRLSRLLLLGAVLLGLSVGMAHADENLRLQASYQGIFSFGQKLPVADVRLQTRRPGKADYLETTLDASSVAYPYVEALYPIRFRLRTWYTQHPDRVLAAEYFDGHGGRPGKHQLMYPEKSGPGLAVHDLTPKRQLDLPALEAGTYVPPAGLPRIFDRLGLLQRVRTAPLQVGEVLQFPVSNGQQRLTYRVKVEKRDRLRVAGRTWQALKLRFDGSYIDKRGYKQAAHRPVYVWLSDDARHLPLLAVARVAIGRFVIDLVSAGTDAKPAPQVPAGPVSGAGAAKPDR